MFSMILLQHLRVFLNALSRKLSFFGKSMFFASPQSLELILSAEVPARSLSYASMSHLLLQVALSTRVSQCLEFLSECADETQ